MALAAVVGGVGEWLWVWLWVWLGRGSGALVCNTAAGDILFSVPIPAMRWVADRLNVISKKKKPTTPAVPRRSPIQVLSRPDAA